MKKQKTLITTFILSVLVLSGTIVSAIENNSKKSISNHFKPANIINGIVENETGTNTVTSKDYTFSNINETLSVDKQVEIINVDAQNDNNADAFVRATIIPIWITDTNTNNTNSFVVGAMNDIINNNINEKILETQVDEYNNKISIQTTYQDDNNSDYLDISSFTNLKDITILNNAFTTGDITFTLDDNWNENWFFNSNDGYFYYKYVLEPGQKTEPLLKSVSIDDSKLYKYNNNSITLQVDILSDSVQAMGEALNELWTNVEKNITTNTSGDIDEEHKYGYILEEVTTVTTTPTNS